MLFSLYSTSLLCARASRWTLTLLPAVLASSAAGQITPLGEHPIDVLPCDVAVTPDGEVAVVRGMTPLGTEQDRITVWLMSQAQKVPGTGCTGLWGRAAGNNGVSDMLQCTNARAICIGSTDEYGPIGGEDTTYVDILDISTADDPLNIWSCLASYRLTGTSGLDVAGIVSDVAITPKGKYAIVNHQNWIHVFNLRTGAIALQQNIGIQGPRSPSGCADSIAVKDDYGAVITRWGSQSLVYALDLTGPLPAVAWSAPFKQASTAPEAVPHDVAITPDGTRAVVTGHDVAALVDLTQPTGSNNPKIVVQASVKRFWRDTVDSVEVTNYRAVTIGSKPSAPWQWHIEVHDITSPGAFAAPLATYDADPIGEDNRAHDLEICAGQDRAVIRTQRQVIVIPSLTNPPSTLPASHMLDTTGDPLLSLQPPPNQGTFVSDSVVVSPRPIDDYDIAVLIGSWGKEGTSDRAGYVEFLDMPPSPDAPSLYTCELYNQGEDITPADLNLTHDKDHVVVRSVATGEAPPGYGNYDLSYFSVGQHSLIDITGGNGEIFALDSLEIGSSRAVSVSERYGQGTGWVHFIGF